MSMRNYVERAKDFVKEIYPYMERANFGCYEMVDEVELFNEEKNRKVLFRHGIARVALISSDYVVKYEYDPEEVEAVGGGEAEIELYEQAKEDGFAYLLAEVTRFVYNGKRFYIMPRIRGINEDNWYHADHFMTDAEREWCDKVNLSDLHCNNYGFRKGKVCLIDYACHLDYASSEYSSSESSSWS